MDKWGLEEKCNWDGPAVECRAVESHIGIVSLYPCSNTLRMNINSIYFRAGTKQVDVGWTAAERYF